jgi:nucleoside-diphosphate-sugar epimerase
VTVRELLSAGHQVVGLVRSDASAAALTATGATALRGSLEDLDSLRRGASEADGVIHTAFTHGDPSKFAQSCAADQRAIATIGDVLAGSNKPFAIASGTPMVPGGVATENDIGDRTNPVSSLRAPAEDITLALAERGVRSSVVRLPRCVHGASEDGWRGGLASRLIDIAKAKGVAAYVGDGTQRWPAVHRLDAARLFRIAIEQAPAGTRLHAVGDEGIAMRELATVIARRLELPVASKSPDEAAAHFSFFASIVSRDQPASNALTRERFGWQPREVGLLADFEAHFA